VKIYARWALVAPDELRPSVVLTIADGRIEAVCEGGEREADEIVDLLTPGFSNCHSHAFHRGLRGRQLSAADDFWGWREAMYDFSAKLDPDRYREFATLVFREMLLAGFTSVGEFHYLHHGDGGQWYHDPNAMGQALIDAAEIAGIRLGLIDVCYLHGGLSQQGYLPLQGPQRRFGDRDPDHYLARVSELSSSARVRILRGIHSLRAVSLDEMEAVLAEGPVGPWHLHLMEQTKEVADIVGFYGQRPLELLSERGLLGPQTTLVHLNQLESDEVAIVRSHNAVTCACPSTEENLADGLSPAASLIAAGARVSLGTDQHMRIDALGEAGQLDAHVRLRTLRRTGLATADLWRALLAHETIGFGEVGRLEAGAWADLVAIDLGEVGIAGSDPFEVVRCGSRAAISKVWTAGVPVASELADERREVGRLLAELLQRLWQE
jgi:formiminoglutamate deiminase